jgi:hypothetical protein
MVVVDGNDEESVGVVGHPGGWHNHHHRTAIAVIHHHRHLHESWRAMGWWDGGIDAGIAMMMSMTIDND